MVSRIVIAAVVFILGGILAVMMLTPSAVIWYHHNGDKPTPPMVEASELAPSATIKARAKNKVDPWALPKPSASASRSGSASVVTVPRTNGQFYTQARVNHGSVRFLVDTGASVVALTPSDAQRSGIDTRSLSYTQPINTANGRAYAANVKVKSLSIGGIRVRNVEAMVVPQGLDISLLGMSFLSKLQKVEATPNQLILRY